MTSRLYNCMTSSLYRYNVGIVKRYTDKHYKLTHMSTVRQKCIETDEVHFTAKGDAGNDSKLEESLLRTKRTVMELGLCNSWPLFCTFTLDGSKYDRKDLKKYNKDFSQFVRDCRKKYGCKISFLFIPEQHQDGSWHMHGFLEGLPIEHLREFTLKDHLPYKILDRIKQGKHIFTWEAYAQKFGFCDIEFVENQEAVARYITKYITKDLADRAKELNAHLYYSSKGLKHAEVVYRGDMLREIENPDYKGDYATVKAFDCLSEAMSYFADSPFSFDDDTRRYAVQPPCVVGEGGAV